MLILLFPGDDFISLHPRHRTMLGVWLERLLVVYSLEFCLSPRLAQSEHVQSGRFTIHLAKFALDGRLCSTITGTVEPLNRGHFGGQAFCPL